MKRSTMSLTFAACLFAASGAALATDCAGGVDATGNECNAGAPTPVVAQEGDVKRLEAERASARIEALKASVKQQEMKVASAKSTLVGAERDLQKMREALEEAEEALAKKRFW